MRTKEAAARVGLAAQTLARWRVEGSPIPFARIGRAIVYDTRDLEAYIEGRKVHSTAEATARTA